MTVEDGVFIGPGAILTNDRYPRAITSTASSPGPTTGRSARSALRRRSIGAGAVVVAGVDVGGFAMVGAGAVVTDTSPTTPSSPATRPGASAGCAPAARA